MTGLELLAILPILVLAAAIVVVMLVVGFRRRHGLAAGLTLISLVTAALTVPIAAGTGVDRVTTLMVNDGFGLYYTMLVLVSSAVVTVFGWVHLRVRTGQHEEFYLLVLLATLGAAVLAASDHFATFFIGLEILGVSLYALIAYPRTQGRPLEAAIKYLVLAAVSSAVLLFGIAMLYADAGTLTFRGIAVHLETGVGPRTLVGLALVLAGFGFKLALVPFHLWTPDVYQGAPAPVTALLATVSKGGVLAVLLRVFHEDAARAQPTVVTALTLLAVASMLIGNLLALRQKNLKRLLGFSSIAHFGYVLVALLAGGERGIEAVNYYVAAYFATSLVAFGVITAMSPANRDADLIEDYRGLFWRRPWIAFALTIAMFSLAGVPLTAGFFAKFFVVAAGVSTSEIALVIVLIAGSAIGLYYYLRVVVAMFTAVDDDGSLEAPIAGRIGFVLAGLVVVVIWLGVAPGGLLTLLAGAGLGG